MDESRGYLYQHATALGSLSATLLHFAKVGNDRLTINQVTFFLLAARADARGQALTLNELMEATEGVIGQSVKNTYKALLEPKGRNPKTTTALGWLTRETDPNDERRKYLRLTPLGREIAEAAVLKFCQHT
jgi:hypothetical protein